MKLLFATALITLLSFCACKGRKNNITHPEEYAAWLNGDAIKKRVTDLQTEAAFWEKRLLRDTGDYVNMRELARYQISLFKATGDIHCLLKGDSLLERCNVKLNHTNPDIWYALSQNAVTRHDFKRSAACIAAAEKAAGDAYTIRLLQFDTYMELGRYNEAYRSLSSLKDQTSFDYLIRKAKWEDHSGNLNAAIGLMEKARQLVKDKNEARYLWTVSNLSDMYGHAGRIGEAYRGYLEVLRKDPADLYCLKGIAWIALSHDQDYREAERIVQYILAHTAMPDLKLLLADIALQQGDLVTRNRLLADFLTATAIPAYGNMYNKYRIKILAADAREYSKAAALAEAELNNRFTPETCGWLAWACYQQGDRQRATELADKFVLNKTHEPDTKFLLGCIYAGTGDHRKARLLFADCLESAFELGPVTVQQIRQAEALF